MSTPWSNQSLAQGGRCAESCMLGNFGHPKLVSIITKSLLLWQSSSHGFLGTPSNEQLQLAIKRQQNID
jgi:hypothetical protein